MADDKVHFPSLIFGVLLGGFLSGILFFPVGESSGRTEVHQEAVRKGFAHYNELSGNWEWKQSPPER